MSEINQTPEPQPTTAWEIGAIVALVMIVIALIVATIYETRRRKRRQRQRVLEVEEAAPGDKETIESSGPGRPATLSRPEPAMIIPPPKYYWMPR